MVKSGHAPAEVELFVDGESEQANDVTFASPLDLTQEGDFAFGGFSGSTFETSGIFDDGALWARALTSAEVRALYRRGALRMGVEVRICGEPDCSDEPPFVGGPNLEPGVLFTDPADATSPGAEIPVAGLEIGRYAQYRLVLSGLSGDVSPAIASVTLRGEFL